MAPLNRVIIDTDPGVDDMLAMLLAFAAKPEELEILLLSVTYGNVEVTSCLRNVVALFHVLEKELAWRKSRGQLEGFGTMSFSKPIVAIGADHPLEDDTLAADYFHGRDGLAGVHDSHPHLSPAETWKALFDATHEAKEGATADEIAAARELASPSPSFTASQVPAHKEILRLLKENPADTITIIAVGPLTNLALAASEDPETFLRVKEVVVMGGAIDVEGNITPLAEFNTYADAVATARVFALTSPSPWTTMPPPPLVKGLPLYPKGLSKQLKLTLFPLDITTPHKLFKSQLDAKLNPLIAAGSPLAEWTSAFVGKTYEKIVSLGSAHTDDPGLDLHDPLTIWYMLTRASPSWISAPKAPEDIRVETAGQWSRGMHVIDRRPRKKLGADPVLEQVKSPGAVDITNPMESLVVSTEGELGEEEGRDAPGDNGGWLDVRKGNRINRIVGTPGEDAFGPYLLERVFG